MFQSFSIMFIAFFKGLAHGMQTLANLLAIGNAASTGYLAEQMSEFTLTTEAIDETLTKADALIGIKAKAPKEPANK